jgi:hypothetical protein
LDDKLPFLGTTEVTEKDSVSSKEADKKVKTSGGGK